MNQKMATVGNTFYVFDSNGDGMSFTSMGRVISSVKFSNVSLTLRNIQDVQVISILGLPNVNKCDILFGCVAGTSCMTQRELVLKARQLPCLNIVPLRVMRVEEPGLLQVLYTVRPGAVSKEYLSELFGVKEWRSL